MKTLTILKPILYLFILASFLTACKGDDPVAPLKTIDGKWEGYTKVTGDPTEVYLAFNNTLDKDANGENILQVMDNEADKTQVTGTGTWKLTAGVYEATFVYDINPQTSRYYKADFDDKTGELTYGIHKVGAANTGTWYMKKQP